MKAIWNTLGYKTNSNNNINKIMNAMGFATNGSGGVKKIKGNGASDIRVRCSLYRFKTDSEKCISEYKKLTHRLKMENEHLASMMLFLQE